MKRKIILITIIVQDPQHAIHFYSDPEGHYWEVAYNSFMDLT